jgi:hypothetical protein
VPTKAKKIDISKIIFFIVVSPQLPLINKYSVSITAINNHLQ